MKSDYRELQKEAFECSKDHGWWDNCITQTEFGPAINMEKARADIPTKLCLIHSEVSEALEAYRDGAIGLRRSDSGKWEGLPSELADVVIRVMDLSEALGIDLLDVINKKMEYNRTRPRRHGGKLC